MIYGDLLMMTLMGNEKPLGVDFQGFSVSNDDLLVSLGIIA